MTNSPISIGSVFLVSLLVACGGAADPAPATPSGSRSLVLDSTPPSDAAGKASSPSSGADAPPAEGLHRFHPTVLGSYTVDVSCELKENKGSPKNDDGSASASTTCTDIKDGILIFYHQHQGVPRDAVYQAARKDIDLIDLLLGEGVEKHERPITLGDASGAEISWKRSDGETWLARIVAVDGEALSVMVESKNAMGSSHAGEHARAVLESIRFPR